MTATHAVAATPAPAAATSAMPQSYEEIVALAGQKRELLLQSQLVNDVHVVSFAPGHLSIRLRDGAAPSIVGQLSDRLAQWTGQRWMISLSREQGGATLGETRRADETATRREVLAHPVVAEIMQVFPGAQLKDIRQDDGPEN